MAKFTREEVIQVVLGARKCEGAYLQDIDLRGADLMLTNHASLQKVSPWSSFQSMGSDNEKL
jgi:hypothetical protein|tara:strand:- start:857 stop:1042 length:186 start_codon:yes stop_codon:yes gene_type:complete